MMPTMNGYEFLEKIRQDARTRELKILMLTANDTDQNELKMIKGGADDFVSKTTSSNILVARINRLLNR